ncbi:MAG TPA: chemotaxis protein CheA [Clostridiaceae bacterium]|nr:chemotaxis protein CheA [Clostridiaceae bacterium]
MSTNYSNEPLLDMYIFETEQLLGQLEQLILDSEKTDGFSREAIDEIFRIMHTIKGSSAMMMFNGVSNLAHCMEDLFYCLRDGKYESIDSSYISDMVFEGIDFIKEEITKIKNGDTTEGDPLIIIKKINTHIKELKGDVSAVSDHQKEAGAENLQKASQSENSQYYPKYAYKAVLHFEDGCEMENIRAFSVVHNLKDITSELTHFPEDLLNNECSEDIKKNGFQILFRSDLRYDRIQEVLLQTIFLRKLELTELESEEFNKPGNIKKPDHNNPAEKQEAPKTPKIKTQKESQLSSSHQNILSVDVLKLDKLMDLVGEMVIAEAMVIQNPDLDGLELNNFQKAAQRLDKITKEIQDMVMSIRMVSLAATFQKMNRIVRDMCKKLDKEAKLVITGEETEVDKNIIEHISDPLMHLVRNAVDHGIESAQEREASGKSGCGTIMLEAKSAGRDVLITVRDDGKGLRKEEILRKAKEKGLLYKSESDMTDREIYNLVLLPGFSTKDDITEYSGRGVGMDVVAKNIETIGGSVLVDSTPNSGTTITLKIPLTLAIIDGMNIKVGKTVFTLPTISIMESFRPKEGETFTDPEGNEMIMVRGNCYPILRLHQYYNIATDITDFTDGIVIMVEHDDKTLCIFADDLLGQQQIVVKSLPKYIRDFKKIKGLAGCTLLGDGSISLILDIGGLVYG